MTVYAGTPTRPRVDLPLLAIVAVLLFLGIAAVYSASFVFARLEFGDPLYLTGQQLRWALVGLVLMFVCARIDYHRWRAWSALILLVALAGLVATHLPGMGYTQNGATRWLQIGPLPPLTPSEFLKPALVIYLAAWLAGRLDKVKRLGSGLLPFLLITGLATTLVLLQPDLGTALVVAVVSGLLFFVAGGDLKQLIALGAIGSFFVSPVVLAAGYRVARIEAFFDPWKDPQGKGFHIIQSLIALGSGGITGLGLGASRQKFLYVPGSHTDAIYAIIGEEIGLIGCLVVIGLFGALAYRGFRIAFTARDVFGTLLAVGIVSWLLVQAVINIGGIIKLIPFTGIPLPFISFGGSSLITSLAGIGILLSVSRQCRPSSSP